MSRRDSSAKPCTGPISSPPKSQGDPQGLVKEAAAKINLDELLKTAFSPK